MEDALSRSSIESSSTGEDFVMINGEPKLKITGDINDIGVEISDESSSDLMKSAASSLDMDGSDAGAKVVGQDVKGKIFTFNPISSSQSADVLTMAVSNDNKGIAGGDGYGTSRGRSTSLPTTPGDEFTLFDGVTYLGCATVNAPRSEKEIYRNMAILNEQSQMSIPVTLSIPNTSEGTVMLIDPATQTDIVSYKIHRILLCVRGPVESDERRCFAFTCSHGESAETTIFQCHVFKCDLAEAVGKILYCFGTTFRRKLRSVQELQSPLLPPDMEQSNLFNVMMEFKEDDGKGNYTTCPKDKNVFKFRCNFEKKIVITVQQTGPKELCIERCFGLLVSPGRNVKDGDMHLIEMDSMGNSSDGKSYVISGHWDPTESSFAVLNTETPKDTRVFMTVAIDLVLHGIQEPVRFAIETKAKIYPQMERFWYFTKRPHYEMFHVTVKQIESSMKDEQAYEVMNVQSQTDIDKRKKLTLTIPSTKPLPEEIQTPIEGDDPESDGDEPLLSGSGSVSKEVTDDNLLEAWREVLTKWHGNLAQRPRQVTGLSRKGIPEALRGEVWQLLTGCPNNMELMEAYRVLIGKESPNEQTISRDINRTFPAHDFFKEAGGIGQDSLYKISKAYSVYDEEIGYCQGLSFLAAALLLHMPEEQAFSVLVKIMFDYGLRDLFKSDFEELHLKFYQLERLMQDQFPDLFEHFVDMGLEAHMFASQWFLTLFTAKFPLHMVFHILDLYLSEGKDVIFSVAMALLKHARKDLLALDFEGVLKYFRVHLPKRYRSEDAAKELVQTAAGMKVSSKKLKKYEKEFILIKEQEEDPLDRYERENKKLIEANMRLEQENDDLAHELVTCKLGLRGEVDKLEDNCEILNKELLQSQSALVDTEEEKRRLELESAQLKEMCRRELDRAESENTRNGAIIADYKQICSQLSERLEKQQTAAREDIQKIKDQVKSCELCSKVFSMDGRIKLISATMIEEEQNQTMFDLEKQVRELELELAQTKLALVESECKLQDQTHQLNAALSELQASKNTWFHKTLSSIKEATTSKKDSLKERTGSEGS